MIEANQTIVSYLKAGYLLHVMTFLEVFILVFLFYIFPIMEWLMEENFILRLLILFPLFLSPIFPQLDARSRFQNYKMIKDHLFIYGFQPRMLKPFVKSRCQRDAVITAAEELGMGKQCKDFFKSKGYRWYHLFPDVIFTKPSVLLKKDFWITTFFTKTYHPKIDFKKSKKNRNIIKGITCLETL